MSHYEERLEADLRMLRDRMARQGETVREALRAAVHAFLTLDRKLAAATILGDNPVNRASREIDRRCHAFVARHVPGAGHLRFVSSVMRINVLLERIGDYAVTIARETAQAKEPPPRQLVGDIQMMADHDRRVLEQAMTAFSEGNAELARGTMGLASQKGRIFHRVFTDLLREGEKRSRGMEDLFGLLAVLYRLERVGNQVKNLCEETIFIATGETKQAKVYSILFVDEANDRWSQMAEAIARKAYPESGTYRSAGWRPAAAIDPRVAAFFDRRGYAVRHARPDLLPVRYDDLADYNVIVGLQPGTRSHIAELPFQTVLVEWDVVDDSEAVDDETLEHVWKRMAHEIRDLMEILRGEGTD